MKLAVGHVAVANCMCGQEKFLCYLQYSKVTVIICFSSAQSSQQKLIALVNLCFFPAFFFFTVLYMACT